jgi:hypothetical protein
VAVQALTGFGTLAPLAAWCWASLRTTVDSVPDGEISYHAAFAAEA